ncbi:hypothetical protein [Miltoncostaea oceani]|uniref:hypothetical protein n=1 Tax=Miltoncostaea oceani TaxID=2843216 RepID=UPI001C3E6430|nr:hypothetical protein [Miltoncostaea oceani]
MSDPASCVWSDPWAGWPTLAEAELLLGVPPRRLAGPVRDLRLHPCAILEFAAHHGTPVDAVVESLKEIAGRPHDPYVSARVEDLVRRWLASHLGPKSG